jgi:hypothetical protein
MRMALRTLMLWGCLFGMFALPRLGGSSWGHIVHAPCHSCPASTVPLRLVLRGGKGRDGLASTEAVAQGEEGSRERGKVPLQSCRGLVGRAICDCSVNQWANDSFATKCVKLIEWIDEHRTRNPTTAVQKHGSTRSAAMLVFRRSRAKSARNQVSALVCMR